MSRFARRSDPPNRSIQRVELTDGHLTLRLVLVVVLLLVAVLAFGAAVNQLLTAKSGWQEIDPTGSESGIAQEFVLFYYLDQDADREGKAVSALYGDTLERAYRALSNEELEGTVNLASLNRQPNTPLTVDPLLHAAFETVESSGCRLPYFAPLMGLYDSLFSCTYDQEAELFDPARSQPQAEFAAEIAAFAADPEAVRVECLPEGKLRLLVSPEYLAYAQENEVESLVDFGILRNAFLCDAVADALGEQGYDDGYISSFDGYSRVLCAEEFGLNVFDRVDGQTSQMGTVTYTGPAALVSCRSFPILEMDQRNYYVYSDGAVRPPYLNERGLLHAAAGSLSVLSRQESVAALALQVLPAFAGEEEAFPALSQLSWVSGRDGQLQLHGPDFLPTE